MIRTTTSTMANLARRQFCLFSGINSSILPHSAPSSTTISNTPTTTHHNNLITTRDMTILSKESKAEFKNQNYSSRMAKKGQPVSPHVTIYSFPVCALSSITTRVTGCALSFGSAGLGLVEIVGGNGAALQLMSNIGSSELFGVAAVAKLGVAFPFVYHYLGGLRHLVWDNSPDMLTNVGVEKASYILVGTSVLVSGVAAVL